MNDETTICISIDCDKLYFSNLNDTLKQTAAFFGVAFFRNFQSVGEEKKTEK